MTTEERDAIIRRELDIYDQLDEIESALHKARIALGNLTDEVCQMRRNTETHDIRTETHECVKEQTDCPYKEYPCDVCDEQADCPWNKPQMYDSRRDYEYDKALEEMEREE